MSIPIAVLGCALILAVLWDAFETIILPRRVARRFRLTAFFYRFTWRPWCAAARRIRSTRRREAYLGYYGPLSTVLLLSVWTGGMILGFAMLHWAAGSRSQGFVFATDLYLSGTTYFTLGLGDVTPHTPVARALTVAEAGLGFGFLAIVIGYFPVLYQAFSRREANISLLDARAGSPSSAAEMLLRYRGNADRLDSALRDFERWTAELLESHISYPVLSYFRSQHDNQSWLGAITTILDTCALAMVGLKNLSPWQPQMTFAIARHAVVDISQILKSPPRAPEPDRLPREEFLRVRAELAGCATAEDGDGGYQRLAELRAMYEPYVNALSSYLAMDLPGWLPRKRLVHNWETSAWERAAAAVPATLLEPVEDAHE